MTRNRAITGNLNQKGLSNTFRMTNEKLEKEFRLNPMSSAAA